MWLLNQPNYEQPIGAVVKLSDSGQVKVTDDSGKVCFYSSIYLHMFKLLQKYLLPIKKLELTFTL